MCMQIFHYSWYPFKIDLKPKFVMFTKSWGLLMGRRDVVWFVNYTLMFSDFDDQKHLLPSLKENRNVHTQLLDVFKEFKILQRVLLGQTHLATHVLPFLTSIGFLRRYNNVSSLTNNIVVQNKNTMTNKQCCTCDTISSMFLPCVCVWHYFYFVVFGSGCAVIDCIWIP
jgi:hypothetical protein